MNRSYAGGSLDLRYPAKTEIFAPKGKSIMKILRMGLLAFILALASLSAMAATAVYQTGISPEASSDNMDIQFITTGGRQTFRGPIVPGAATESANWTISVESAAG